MLNRVAQPYGRKSNVLFVWEGSYAGSDPEEARQVAREVWSTAVKDIIPVQARVGLDSWTLEFCSDSGRTIWVPRLRHSRRRVDVANMTVTWSILSDAFDVPPDDDINGDWLQSSFESAVDVAQQFVLEAFLSTYSEFASQLAEVECNKYGESVIEVFRP